MAYVVMAYIVMTYIVMACVVMAYTSMAYIVMLRPVKKGNCKRAGAAGLFRWACCDEKKQKRMKKRGDLSQEGTSQI